MPSVLGCRGDRPQVCIGLVVTEDGFPLGYEVFAGNTHDSRTVKTIIEAMEKRHGTLNRVWVMDRGMVSEENLRYLRERGGQYIVGTPKAMLRHFEQHFVEQDWTEAQEGVEVKLVPGLDGEETFLLARSADRRAKEQAMHAKLTARMEAGLVKMQVAAAAGWLKDEAAAGERLGRLKEQNWRAAQAFEAKTNRDSGQTRGIPRICRGNVRQKRPKEGPGKRIELTIGYERVGDLWPGILKASCWAHGRRKLEECHYRGATPQTHTAPAFLRQLFDLEDLYQHQSDKECLAGRQAKSQPIVQEFQSRPSKRTCYRPPRPLVCADVNAPFMHAA